MLRSVRGPATTVASLAQRHITDICAGASHCVAVSSLTGRAWAWGSNYCGELGSEGDATESPREVALRKGETFVRVVAGNCFNVAMTRGSGDHVGSEVVDTLRFDSESESDPRGFHTMDANRTQQLVQAEVARAMGQAEVVRAMGKTEVARAMGQAEVVRAMGKTEVVRAMGKTEVVRAIGQTVLTRTTGQTTKRTPFERVETDRVTGEADKQTREGLSEGDQNDIIFASRAERAAALERQFRSLRS